MESVFAYLVVGNNAWKLLAVITHHNSPHITIPSKPRSDSDIPFLSEFWAVSTGFPSFPSLSFLNESFSILRNGALFHAVFLCLISIKSEISWDLYNVLLYYYRALPSLSSIWSCSWIREQLASLGFLLFNETTKNHMSSSSSLWTWPSFNHRQIHRQKMEGEAQKCVNNYDDEFSYNYQFRKRMPITLSKET